MKKRHLLNTKFNHKQKLIDEADALFKKAADDDVPFIERTMVYHAGTEDEKAKWCIKGANRGIRGFAYLYATRLNEGKGVSIDKNEALIWAKLAFVESVEPNSRKQAQELTIKLMTDLARR